MLPSAVFSFTHAPIQYRDVFLLIIEVLSHWSFLRHPDARHGAWERNRHLPLRTRSWSILVALLGWLRKPSLCGHPFFFEIDGFRSDLRVPATSPHVLARHKNQHLISGQKVRTTCPPTQTCTQNAGKRTTVPDCWLFCRQRSKERTLSTTVYYMYGHS